jgi:hypothetical protein
LIVRSKKQKCSQTSHSSISSKKEHILLSQAVLSHLTRVEEKNNHCRAATIRQASRLVGFAYFQTSRKPKEKSVPRILDGKVITRLSTSSSQIIQVPLLRPLGIRAKCPDRRNHYCRHLVSGGWLSAFPSGPNFAPTARNDCPIIQ